MSIPTVSIGLPVYNGENYLKWAVDSILNQTYRDFELIISDNASTDKTMELCGAYAKEDSRISYYRNENNLGASWNFNRVFHLSKGKYFQWACHDDMLEPTLLERCVDVLDRIPEVVLCYTKTTFIDQEGKPLWSVIGRPDLHIKGPHRRLRPFLKYHYPPNECSPVLGLFRSDVLKKTALIGKYPASDMILLGEVALHGEFYEIPECLFIRRDHPLKSTKAFPTMEERAVWFDPSQKGKTQWATWRWFLEWLKSVIRSPIGVGEGLICLMEVWEWAVWNRRNMAREFKHGFKTLL